jgi:hypothetical protein
VAVSAIAQEQHGEEIRASVTQARGDMLTGQREHSRQVRQERETSQRDMDQLVQQAGTGQQNERSAVRRDVDVHRRSWTDEQRKAVDRAAADADSAGADGQTKITRAGDDGEREAAGHINDGNRDIAAARTKAESDAAAKRRDAEAESSDGGFFSWLGSKVTAFFDRVKNAIHAVFDLARKAVQAAIRKAQELAARAIDAARRAVIAAIRAVGDALIAIGDRLLAGFPGLRDRFRRAIKERVAAAERAVNAIADRLKRDIQAALDLLGRALTALLDAYEALYRMAIDLVAGVVRGAIDAARRFIQALAEWGQIIADIAAHPGQWLRNLGRAAIDGVRNCLWGALKRAVKEWFRSKVEEVIGVAKVIYQILVRGCISFADVARMAWDGLKAAIPGMLIQLLIEKLIALIIPAAGALSLIIDGLRAAWGAASRILQAFQRFMAFLRKVGRGGPEAAGAFANMLAAAAVAVLDFLANFLIGRLRGAGSQIGGRLQALAQAIQRRLGGVARAVMGGVRAARRGVVAAARTVTRLARRAVQAVGRGAVRLAQAVARSPVGRIVARAGRAFMRTRLGQALGRYGRSARNWLSRKAQQFRDWRERVRERRRRRREERRADDMARARRALPPAIHRLLASGVSEWLLKLRLGAWRLSYRLRLLTLRASGRYESVVAANSPEEDLVAGIIRPSGEELSRRLHQLETSVMEDPEVVRLAEQILEQRRQRRGTEQSPLLGPVGYGGAPAALEARRQALLGPGEPGTRQVVPGIPGLTARRVTAGQRYPQEEFIRVVPSLPGTEVREVAAGSLHPGRIVVAGPGAYRAVAANPPQNPQEFMRAVFAMQAGERPPTGLSAVDLNRAAGLARLSQVESARGGLLSERLGSQLAARGQLSFGERYGPEQPMTGRGAGATYRRSLRTLGLPPVPGLGTSESGATDVRAFISARLRLVERFVLYQMLTQKELFDNEERLENYVRGHLIDHLRADLFAAATRGGAE